MPLPTRRGPAPASRPPSSREPAPGRAWASAAFLAGYRSIGGADILPPDDDGWAALLDAFLLQKAIYELEYELNNRPGWVGIPLQGIVGVLRG
jgi:predicted trehalose synthase